MKVYYPNPSRPARIAAVVGFPASTTLKDGERTLILGALEASGWVVGGPYGAAARLGMKRTTLAAQMKKHEILRPAEEISLDEDLRDNS
jgi:formate hydrogenlyase transcriptional activator